MLGKTVNFLILPVDVAPYKSIFSLMVHINDKLTDPVEVKTLVEAIKLLNDAHAEKNANYSLPLDHVLYETLEILKDLSDDDLAKYPQDIPADVKLISDRLIKNDGKYGVLQSSGMFPPLPADKKSRNRSKVSTRPTPSPLSSSLSSSSGKKSSTKTVSSKKMAKDEEDEDEEDEVEEEEEYEVEEEEEEEVEEEEEEEEEDEAEEVEEEEKEEEEEQRQLFRIGKTLSSTIKKSPKNRTFPSSSKKRPVKSLPLHSSSSKVHLDGSSDLFLKKEPSASTSMRFPRKASSASDKIGMFDDHEEEEEKDEDDMDDSIARKW
jgi:hypothetical protein